MGKNSFLCYFVISFLGTSAEMLFINQSISAQAAKDYFRDQLSRSDYYLKDGPEVTGEWHGLGAQLLGLRGPVDRDSYFRLCDNQHPTTGEQLTPRMAQQDGYRLIQRYAKRAGIKTRIGNHSMRATGITDYLKSDGSLTEARKMANHADTRTTQLYDRRGDAASLDEYGKVGI